MRSQSSASKYSSRWSWQNDTRLRSVGSCTLSAVGDADPEPLGDPKLLSSSGVYGGVTLRQLFMLREGGGRALCGHTI